MQRSDAEWEKSKKCGLEQRHGICGPDGRYMIDMKVKVADGKVLVGYIWRVYIIVMLETEGNV
jgi:hypothetical protein